MPFKGVHRTMFPSRATGVKRYYYYTHRGGTKFWHCDHKPIEETHSKLPAAFIDAYQAATGHGIITSKAGSFRAVMTRYFIKSPKYLRMKPKGRAARRDYLETWGEMLLKTGATLNVTPIGLMDKRGIISHLVNYRDETWGHSLSTSDEAVIALSAFLSWCVKDGKLDFNRAQSIEYIYERPTTNKIWTPEQQATFHQGASAPLSFAMRLDLFCGLRLGDLVAIPVTAETDNHLLVRTSKGGGTAIIPKIPPLQALLAELAAYRSGFEVQSTTLLVNTKGLPWTASGLSTSFDRRRTKIGLGAQDAGPTFHDLRKTAATNMVIAQKTHAAITDEVLVDLFAWTPATLRKMKRIYVNDDAVIAAITNTRAP